MRFGGNGPRGNLASTVASGSTRFAPPKVAVNVAISVIATWTVARNRPGSEAKLSALSPVRPPRRRAPEPSPAGHDDRDLRGTEESVGRDERDDNQNFPNVAGNHAGFLASGPVS